MLSIHIYIIVSTLKLRTVPPLLSPCSNRFIIIPITLKLYMVKTLARKLAKRSTGIIISCTRGSPNLSSFFWRRPVHDTSPLAVNLRNQNLLNKKKKVKKDCNNLRLFPLSPYQYHIYNYSVATNDYLQGVVLAVVQVRHLL